MNTVEQILRQYNAELPLEEAVLIPKTWYTHSEIYQLERKAVFGSGWNYVGRSEQLKKAGDYITVDLADEPLLIARTKNNTLSAMTNICRHKAAKIMHSACGNAPAFCCRYHGWTYDLDGNLKATPEFTTEKNFDKSSICLPKFQVEEVGPLVFVNLNREKTEPLSHFLTPLMEKLNPVMPKLKWYAQKTYPVDCNWKVYVDNYLDGGYHINTVHPTLAKSLNYKTYETLILNETVLQQSPLVNNDSLGMNVRGGTHAYYFWLMPNFMVNIYDNVMDTNWVIPDGPDKCKVVFDFYFGESETITEQFKDESIRIADLVQDEDKAVCDSVQLGLKSSNYSPGRFCVKRENGNHHFHQLLAQKLWKSVSVSH